MILTQRAPVVATEKDIENYSTKESSNEECSDPVPTTVYQSIPHLNEEDET